MQAPFWNLLVACAIITPVVAADMPVRLTVQAGPFERRHTEVTFELPPEWRRFQALRTTQGELIPLQVAADGSARFILPHLAPGAQETFALATADRPTAERVTVTRETGKLKLTAGGHALLEYQAEPGEVPRPGIPALFRRGGYLHPIVTPSGKMVTDDFPPNHLHHHGIWWAWTKTEFEDRKPDFWNMGEGKGRVDFSGIEETWSGPVHGGFVARHRFVDLLQLPQTTVLNETWRVRVLEPDPSGTFWTFELISTQQCATSHALFLPEYRYGGLGLRGRRDWDGKDQVNFLTSDGETDRVIGNTSRGRWCDMSGKADGATVGLAVLGHPANFRAPQPMRLHPTEPFFCFAPPQLGSMEIKPGQLYVSRYRVVVHDGGPDRALLDRLWNDYAHPPEVSLQRD